MESYRLKNGNKMIIRGATAADAEEMLNYLEQVGGESDFLTFGPGEIKMTLEDERSFLNSISKADNKLFIVAVVADKIIGNLSYTGGMRPRVRHTGEFGVSVLKEYWGQGVGKILIQYLIAWSKASGTVRKINLRVRSDNTAGIYLYEALGFVEEGRQSREFCINGIFYDSIIMGLEID